MTSEAPALSDSHKSAVRLWVSEVRRLLERDFAAQLERLGMEPSGNHTPLDQLTLSAADQAIRLRAAALLSHETVAEDSAQRGFANVLREFTYTLLNRLIGLKAMEVRKLLFLPPPTSPQAAAEATEVLSPIPGQTRSRYLRDFRAAGGSRYKYDDSAEEALLHDALTSAFRHVTRDIRVLFDPDHEYACVWPTHAALVEVVGKINDGLPEAAYRAHDFLGWVYQFFNREEKKRVRAETKGTPRSSYELAVINQFYTPSWVVKALVDNTLGRLWLQMHPDSALAPTAPPPLPGQRTDPRPVVDYLVPRTGVRIRYQRLGDTGEVERYELARNITLLDPACGTMHFGQYAFALFQQMYLDEIDHAGEEGWPAEPSVSDPRQIPAAILENNLFGIDIDPRAIQIASLSLLLTAKEAALGLGMTPNEVQIQRANLVVANAVDLGKERLGGLVERLGDQLGSPELQERLFATLWENLEQVGELGSLVQVREGVSAVLEDWVEAQAKNQGLEEMIRRKEGPQLQLGDILDDSDRQRALHLAHQRAALEEQAEALQAELLSALEAAAGETAGDPAEQLFAEDTARGLKLLQTLSRTYHVVVMNPPYGSFVPKVKEFIKATYPLTKNDIYAAFIDRATQLVKAEGYVGALVSSTFVNLKSFEKLRTEILLKRNPLLVMLDLGYGILDEATVEAAAIVIKGSAQ